MKKSKTETYRHLLLLLGSGGVGKTWLARLLVALLLKLGIAVRVIDGDEPAKKDLLRFFPDQSEFRDLSRREQIIALFQEILTASEEVVLVDAKADRQTEFKATKLFTAKVVAGWKARERLAVTVLIPVVANKHSSQIVPLDWFDIFGPSARYILVLNEVAGSVDTNSEFLREFITRANPAVIRLPALSAEIASEMDLHALKHETVIRFGDFDFADIPAAYSFTLGGTHAIAEVSDNWEQFVAQAEPIVKKLLAYECAD
jgi:hypothetical protein